MKKAEVIEIQVGGCHTCTTLKDACEEYAEQAGETSIIGEIVDINRGTGTREKISFVIKLPNGEHRHITIRDEDGKTIAYGNLGELPSMTETYQEVQEEC